ncbi:hypothetical protein F444_02887 [Phytophthora nicotianae P1976]|uniref:ZSWIM1/3 RNaseH-like domain-containing protein n=1 Tax=Phytophthora nicotianae P1976 TaxID=1317066 RepID=A0A081AVV4_PHYNI|nr:hypothetical protein F444_02887 [Phytophthora nicotianae P1976]
MRRNSYTSPDDNVCVMEVLQDFSESLGNLANVFRDADTKLTSCIIFQTNLMRPMTRLFPEVMCVDATHGTSINRRVVVHLLNMHSSMGRHKKT